MENNTEPGTYEHSVCSYPHRLIITLTCPALLTSMTKTEQTPKDWFLRMRADALLRDKRKHLPWCYGWVWRITWKLILGGRRGFQVRNVKSITSQPRSLDSGDSRERASTTWAACACVDSKTESALYDRFDRSTWSRIVNSVLAAGTAVSREAAGKGAGLAGERGGAWGHGTLRSQEAVRAPRCFWDLAARRV